MKLFEILKGIDYKLENGQDSIEINKIEYDSRKIEKGDLFVCIEGYATDGHKYVNQAVQKGAKAVLCEKHIELEGATIIKVENSRVALASAAANYYGTPADKLKLIGITGTNGKTTSAFMAKYILEQAGFKVGLIGTIANYIGNKKIHTERTTPESLELQGLFKEMVDEGIDYCVMEVSSHSLFLDRVSGVKFSQAIFTNLTRDHLDFHITFENYYNSKLILFKNTLNSIVNIDDSYGLKLLKDSEGEKTTIAIESHADITAENIEMNSTGASFIVNYKLEKENIKLNLPGKYNVMNALGVIAACANEHISLKVITQGLENMLCVPGRCEIVTAGYNLGYEVIVDYAHTPDGLENILKTAREFTRGRLISVFGCGGDRDKTKRPIMGKNGAELSDIAIITSDNPRGEEPMDIIEDVVKGIEGSNYIVEENRRAAIKKAMSLAKGNDVIVVAGKGHEDYQILKNETIHFDEREVIKEIIDELKQ